MKSAKYAQAMQHHLAPSFCSNCKHSSNSAMDSCPKSTAIGCKFSGRIACHFTNTSAMFPRFSGFSTAKKRIPSLELTYPVQALLKMIFLLQRWDILVPWSVTMVMVSPLRIGLWVVGPSKWASFGLQIGGVILTTYVTYVRARDDAPRVAPQFQQTTYVS